MLRQFSAFSRSCLLSDKNYSGWDFFLAATLDFLGGAILPSELSLAFAPLLNALCPEILSLNVALLWLWLFSYNITDPGCTLSGLDGVIIPIIATTRMRNHVCVNLLAMVRPICIRDRLLAFFVFAIHVPFPISASDLSTNVGAISADSFLGNLLSRISLRS